MFGYVKPEPSELKVKEYNTYKAFYCGLCRCSGKCVSCASRFFLSYDFVFLALLRCALTNEKISFDTKRCMAHPFKKKPFVKENEQLIYSAKASALLTYHKVRDDIADEKGIKKVGKSIFLPYVKRACKKTELGELDAATAEYLSELSSVEQKLSPYADEGAEIFGKLLGEYGGYALCESNARIGREICFRVGKWIYFTDALDDFDRDKKSGGYNPLVLSYKNREEAAQILHASLSKELSYAGAALGLIDCDKGIYNILDNIISKGMPTVTEKIGKKAEKNNERPV